MIPSLHSYIVHFPIALLIVAWVFEIAALLRERPELSRTAWLNQIAGTIGAAAAVATGLWAKSGIPPAGVSAGGIKTHEQFAFVAAALFGILFFWRLSRRGVIPERERRAYLALLFAGVLTLGATGLTGGEIIDHALR